MFGLFKNKKRQAIRNVPLPEEWRQILKSEMPLYNQLPDSDKTELEDILKVLITEKKFVGANDLVVTDEMKVLICGHASLLLLHRKPHYFPHVETIIIYPSAFISNVKEYIGGSSYMEKPLARIGESSSQSGVVVLAWDSVVSGAANVTDGKNVTLHEFAHQLDYENGSTDGAPGLSSNSAYRAWSRVMSQEFEHLQSDLDHHHKTFIDQYGATSPAEFFAVITEAFFEKPRAMKRLHPDMYSLLADYYQQNPVALSAK